jgi:glycerol kinase
LVSGITGGTTRAHLARAVLEGVALQISDILGAMTQDSGTALTQLRVDGGAARNNLLMQYQADILGVSCVRPTVLETTALGAAFLGGLGAGFWTSPAAITEAWVQDRRFDPVMEESDRRTHLMAWKSAVERA